MRPPVYATCRHHSRLPRIRPRCLRRRPRKLLSGLVKILGVDGIYIHLGWLRLDHHQSDSLAGAASAWTRDWHVEARCSRDEAERRRRTEIRPTRVELPSVSTPAH